MIGYHDGLVKTAVQMKNLREEYLPDFDENSVKEIMVRVCQEVNEHLIEVGHTLVLTLYNMN